MQFRKSIFLLNLIGCLFLCSSAYADRWGDFYYTVSNNTVRISGYQGLGGEVVIPDTINSMPVVSIGSFAFQSMGALITGITIPSSVTSIEYWAFIFCKGLTSITIPSSVTSIGPGPFSYCYGLRSIKVDEGNPNFSSLDGVLYNKTKTAMVQFPGGISGKITIRDSVTTIGTETFAGCIGLTSITIPSSVMAIGDWAFERCTALTSIIIPNSVTSIGDSAFDTCTLLTAAYFYGNAPSLGGDVFYPADLITVYYLAGNTGFTNPWYGYPTAVFTDVDRDGVPDDIDNCPNKYNPLQLDANNNGMGDVCDPAPGCGGCGGAACEQYSDSDGDGIPDVIDNCQNGYNPQQLDANGNGLGDCCDPSPGCGGCGQVACDAQCTP